LPTQYRVQTSDCQFKQVSPLKALNDCSWQRRNPSNDRSRFVVDLNSLAQGRRICSEALSAADCPSQFFKSSTTFPHDLQILADSKAEGLYA
jgi:hypothetical protein